MIGIFAVRDRVIEYALDNGSSVTTTLGEMQFQTERRGTLRKANRASHHFLELIETLFGMMDTAESAGLGIRDHIDDKRAVAEHGRMGENRIEPFDQVIWLHTT